MHQNHYLHVSKSLDATEHTVFNYNIILYTNTYFFKPSWVNSLCTHTHTRTQKPYLQSIFPKFSSFK